MSLTATVMHGQPCLGLLLLVLIVCLVGLQVLSFALKPRALWVAAHHLDLSGRMDGLWSALLNAVADLVSGNEAEVDARRYGSSPVAQLPCFLFH